MIVVALVFGIAVTALESWVAMLLIGAIHSSVPGVPPFSYWASLGLVVLVNLLVGFATSAGGGE